MIYNSGNPPAMTPEQKLASKQWRRINSWWIFVPLLSCGLLGWLGFMTAAIRTGKRDYWIYTGIYAGLSAVFVVMVSVTDPEGTASDLATIPLLAAWVAPAVHAAVLNRRYLRELASQGEWYTTPLPATDRHSQPEPPVLGVSNNDYYGPTGDASTSSSAPPPPYAPRLARAAEPQRFSSTTETSGQIEPVNVNTANHVDLGALPGIGESLAQRIIAIRDARGGYRDLDDLAAAANLQPHELVRLRDQVTFDQPNTGRRQGPSEGGSGRILDI